MYGDQPRDRSVTMRLVPRLALVVAVVMLLGSAPAVGAADGKVLASTRGQVAWLDLAAPRARPITSLQLPAYPADVTAVSGSPVAVASIESHFSGNGPMGTDLFTIDLQSGTLQPLLVRASPDELLDAPVMLPDGGSVVFQHRLLGSSAATRVEQIGLDGRMTGLRIDNASQPAPSPDGAQVAFVRYVDHRAELRTYSFADGFESTVLGDDRFISIAYPRYSPDGGSIAFVAVTGLSSAAELHAANAHGIPWEVWLVQSDGSGLHQIADVLNDDPSIAWSPDGARILCMAVGAAT